ncbi:MAG: metallophosphoesterase [Candidatus Marinimicrobia bacterium]|nr:metallophosphoesterase [Candidatus Neomarinimicrobiota bacterium]MCF7829551.1 metallophosphoesterase [Candidatus Neomarinimicrobiota bacterium]MCF7882001.1 metallophosphoesterase [Candidatus Neomarinimicrobiota bacterium]
MNRKDTFINSTSARTVVVGDVHGCIDELRGLIEKISPSPDDRLIFVGDLINKGPDSLGVLKYVQEMGAEVILGNHELAFIEYMDGNYRETSGFREVKRQLGTEHTHWVDWMRNLPLYIETKDALIVHAGIPPGKHPSQVSPEILTNIRTWDGYGEDLQNPDNPAWYELHESEKLVVFGHWARQGLLVRVGVIGLDSGCVYGKRLSAVSLPDRTIFQIDAKEVYEKPGS